MENDRIVIDASVALKWYHPEDGSDSALSLLGSIESHTVTAFAPDLIMYEMINAWIRGMRNDASEIPHILQSFGALSLIIVSPEPDMLTEAAHMAAKQGNLSVYDATYLALARQQQANLITADEKLKRVASKLPEAVGVRLLKEI